MRLRIINWNLDPLLLAFSAMIMVPSAQAAFREKEPFVAIQHSSAMMGVEATVVSATKLDFTPQGNPVLTPQERCTLAKGRYVTILELTGELATVEVKERIYREVNDTELLPGNQCEIGAIVKVARATLVTPNWYVTL